MSRSISQSLFTLCKPVQHGGPSLSSSSSIPFRSQNCEPPEEKGSLQTVRFVCFSQAAQVGGGPAVFGPVHGRSAGFGRLAVQGGAAAGRGPARARGPRPRHEPHGRP